jgi:hypothetical protein
MSSATTLPTPAWATVTLPAIENPNTSGQGYCPAHLGHPLHATAIRFGYRYSHSTPITNLGGTRFVSHTYKARPGEREEHNLSFDHGDIHHRWQTSVSCGSGRKHAGAGQAELERHLAGKARRYGIAKAAA